eukprot:4109428-Pleurochrysis_carterae.AAC.2
MRPRGTCACSSQVLSRSHAYEQTAFEKVAGKHESKKGKISSDCAKARMLAALAPFRHHVDR